MSAENLKEEVDEVTAHYNSSISKVILILFFICGLFSFVTYKQFYAYLLDAKWPDELIENFSILSDQAFLVAYITSWLTGCGADLKLQKVAYRVLAKKQKVKILGIVLPASIGLGGCMVILTWIYGAKVAFWSVMLGFVALDVLAWHILMVRELKATYDVSKIAINDSDIGVSLRRLVVLEAVRDYVAGSWKIYRYVGMEISCLLNILLFSCTSSFGKLASLLHIPTYIIAAIPMAFYFAISEGSMWYRRLTTELVVKSVEKAFGSISVTKYIQQHHADLIHGGKAK